ncbi:MAG: hypothetical protein WKG32_12025 [Gemmatimonadaceae bacterium]
MADDGERARAPAYQYGDFPYLFWDLAPHATLDVENDFVLGRILTRGTMEDIRRLVTLELIQQRLDALPIPEHSRWFWRLVVGEPGTLVPGDAPAVRAG